MKIIKPSWLHHDGSAILSCDFHPDGTKFVTSGHGKQAGIITIWKVDEFFSSNISSPFVKGSDCKIAVLDDHVGCVNCVKFSPDGKFLASGGDDKVIIVWKSARIKTIYSDPGSIESHNESWRVSNMLHGHQADILDIRWSSTGEHLASCSVDSIILIWSEKDFSTPIALLKGHNNFVKGICWDPLGEFIASQSDDNTLKIWSIAEINDISNSHRKMELNIRPIETIKKPFKNCTPITQFLRLDWSPDGEFLVSTHSLNNDGPVAQIIERNSWNYDRDLVGHRQPISVVKFSPILYSDQGETRIMCALGSRDCSVSIWFLPQPRACLVIEDLFSHAIMDLAWSADGKILSATSWDGSIAFIHLEDSDIGRDIRPSKNFASSYKEMYHADDVIEDIDFYKSKNSASVAVNEEITPIISQTIEKERSVVEKLINSPSTQHKAALLSKIGEKIPDKQVESVSKDGKRRIKPVLVAQTIDEDDAPTAVEPEFSKPIREPLKQPSKTDNTQIPLLPLNRRSHQIPTSSKRAKVEDEESNLQDMPVPMDIDAEQLLVTPIIQNSIEITLKHYQSQIHIKFSNTPFCTDPELYNIDIEINASHGWNIVVTAPVTLTATSLTTFYFATNDNKLHCYSVEGMKILPTLVMRHKIGLLTCHEDKFVLIITVYGLLSVWDLVESKILLEEVDIEHLVLNSNVESVSVNFDGMPILVNSDQDSYIYNLHLKAWLPFISSAQILPIDHNSSKPFTYDTFMGLQKLLQTRILNRKSIQRLSPSVQSSCLTSFLEDALFASINIGSNEEFLNFAKLYLSNLCQTNQPIRIKALFGHLLKESQANELLINQKLTKSVNRKALIKELMHVLRSHQNLQQTYSQLKQIYM